MPPERSEGKGDSPLEAALNAFREAWHSGEAPDPDTFCARHPACSQALRAAIDDFLFVAEQLPMAGRDDARPSPREFRRKEFEAGKILGDFRILRELGRGGMGTVFEAEQISLKRKVALKILPPHLSLSDTAVLKFRREAEAGGRQSHPGVVAVFAVGVHEGVHYIVQELVEGGSTLAERVDAVRKESGFPAGYFREAAETLARVAEAMAHAHASGVIHRDLKPSNILLTREGAPKVTDFGLARVEDALSLSRTGDFAGTPYYMSPEQVASRRVAIDGRTDIYSLGVTLYESLTLLRPFEGETSKEVLKKILLHEPRDPHKVNPKVPRDLAVICLKAMEKKPSERYGTMEELAGDLRCFLAGDVITARPAGAVKKIWKRARRNPALAAAVGVAITAVVLLVVLAPWFRSRISSVEAKLEESKGVAEERYRKIQNLTPLEDALLLTQCIEEARTLWPVTRDKIPELEEWLEKAIAIAEGFPEYRRNLDTVREKALPYDEKAMKQNRESHPDWGTLVSLRILRGVLEKSINEINAGEELGSGGSGVPAEERLATQEERLSKTLARIARLEQAVNERCTWLFEDPDDAWQHQQLQKLVSSSEILLNERYGTLKRIQDRLAYAQTVYDTTFVKHEKAWDRAVSSIADPEECPLYRGLAIEPQLGLVPLGRDPQSGLWEFSHLQTGEMPERGPDNRFVLREETGLVFVLLPGGTFRMGAARPSEEGPPGAPNMDPSARPNQGPVHEVMLKPFFLSKYEMTQAQWLRITGENPSRYGPEEWFGDKRHSLLHPVEKVTWERANCVLSNLLLRFPTEAEWEYAVRAGTSTVWWFGNDEASIHGKANLLDRFCRRHGPIQGEMEYDESMDDGWARHAPTGTYPPNPFGLHNVLGNVAEWCRDGWHESYEGAPADGSPWDESIDNLRIIRGGAWTLGPLNCRSAYRENYDQVNGLNYVGLRPARTLGVGD